MYTKQFKDLSQNLKHKEDTNTSSTTETIEEYNYLIGKNIKELIPGINTEDVNFDNSILVFSSTHCIKCLYYLDNILMELNNNSKKSINIVNIKEGINYTFETKVQKLNNHVIHQITVPEQTMKNMGINTFPIYFLLDKKGNIKTFISSTFWLIDNHISA